MHHDARHGSERTEAANQDEKIYVHQLVVSVLAKTEMQIGAPKKRGYKAKRGQEQGEDDARRRKSLEELSSESLGPLLLLELHSLRRDWIKSHKTSSLGAALRSEAIATPKQRGSFKPSQCAYRCTVGAPYRRR